MASKDEPWRRKMLAQGVPEDWSQDMLENFVEVVTRVELEDGGVERFCGVRHTVLLTFLQPLTEENLLHAQTRTRERNKPLQYSLLPSPTTALLAREVGQGVTEDNLFFYFESSRSGGKEGTVTSCDVYPANNMAVIVFSSLEVAEAVLAIRDHSPSKGSQIRVELCYEQFHKKILDSLNKPQSPSVTPAPHTQRGGRGGGRRGGHGPFQKWRPPVADKAPQASPKPPQDRPYVPHSNREPAVYQPQGAPKRGPVPEQPDLLPMPTDRPYISPKPGHYTPRSQPAGYGDSEEQGHFRNRRGSGGNSRPFPQQDHSANTQQGDNSTQHHQQRGRRRRKNKRGNNNYNNSNNNNYRGGSQYESREDLTQPDRSWGNQRGQRSRGRPPFGYYHKRGRGYGGGRQRGGGHTSQPQEAELFDCEPGYVTSPTQSSAPHPIVLDADCNPVPQGWNPQSTATAAPPSEDCYNMEDRGGESNSLDMSLEDISLETDSSQHAETFQPGTPALAAPGSSPACKPPSVQNTAKRFERWAEARDSAARTDNVSQSQRTQEQKAERLKQETQQKLDEAAERLKQKELKLEKKREEERQRLALREQLQQEAQQKTDQETERLKQEKLTLEKEREEERQRLALLQRELERVEQEKEELREELKNRRKETMHFPAYQLRLMQDFAQSCAICDIIIQEKDGTVHISGTGDNVEAVKCAFLCKLQESVEDSVDISPTIAVILRTGAGQTYLGQVAEGYASCSFDVQDSRLVCCAFTMADVQSCLGDLARNIQHGKVQITKSILPQLQAMKPQLESDFPLARISLPSDDSCVMVVEGINGDYELVLRQVKDHCSQNRPDHGVFRLDNPLEIRACTQWCSQDLDDVKALILKNHGDCQALDTPGQMGFTFHCHKGVKAQVDQKLHNLRKVTSVTRLKLHTELTRYSERALVINGIHGQGIEPFCRQLEGRLKKEGGWDTVIHFHLPSKFTLPKFEYTQSKRPSVRPSRPARPPPRLKPPVFARQPRQAFHARSGHGSSHSIRPFSTTVGSSTLTIKSGDICSENVDGLVCVVAEDMDLKQTAVGQAILKKHPQCAQLVPQGSRQAAGSVIAKALQTPQIQMVQQGLGAARRQPQPSMLHLTVLTKWPQQTIMAQVKTLVQRCLQSAVQQGNRSIAFPPLGMGRKFQFPLDTVVSAMVTTVHQFLQGNRGTLQSVVFVIYDVGSARQFREAAKKIIHPPPPAFLGAPQQAVDSDSANDVDDDDDDDNDGGNFFDASADFVTDMDNSPFDDFFQTVQNDDGGGGGFWGSGDGGGHGSDDNDDEEELNFFHYNDEDDQIEVRAAAPQPTPNSFEAHLCLRHQQDLTAVKQGLLRELRSTFVSEDRLTDIRTFKKLGTRTMDEIKTAALKIGVVLTVQNAGGRETLVVRGQREGVVEMMMKIKDKQHAHQQRQETREHRQPGGLPSPAHRVRLPSYWKVCQDKVFKDFEQFVRDHRDFGKLYTIQGEEVNEISTLIQNTWVQRLVGAGKDAVNLSHRGIQITKLERLENPRLWEEYCSHRERLIRRVSQQAFPPIEKAKGSSGPVRTTASLARNSVLKRDMYPQVNEHYLFHGTKKEYLQPIHDQGLDTRIANDKAMLGRGVYASESATKADQYTDDKTNRTSGHKTMILMRVLLGEVFINKQVNPTKYSRPPCKRCYQDRCKCQGTGLFDSVIDDAGRNFREFVIYDRCMCYPEYFITYQRI